MCIRDSFLKPPWRIVVSQVSGWFEHGRARGPACPLSLGMGTHVSPGQRAGRHQGPECPAALRGGSPEQTQFPLLCAGRLRGVEKLPTARSWGWKVALEGASEVRAPEPISTA